MVTCKKAASVAGTTLRYIDPVHGLSAVNAIGTQMPDPIDSEMARSPLALIKMDAVGESGKNTVSKHQIQPERGE